MLRAVAKQLHVLQTEPPEGIKVFMNEGDLTDIQATIEGPCKTKKTFLLNNLLLNDGFFVCENFLSC